MATGYALKTNLLDKLCVSAIKGSQMMALNTVELARIHCSASQIALLGTG